jgi:uncharacterized GH25 family protein
MNTPRSFCTGLLLGLSALSPLPLFAHDTWISPSVYSASVGQSVTFEITSGMKFPGLEVGPKPDRVAKAGFQLAGQKRELKEFTAGKEALRIRTSFDKKGVAIVWVQALPKQIELSDEQVTEYHDEIRAPAEVRKAWARRTPGDKWKEEYTKCAKTCVAIGKTENDRSWSEPVGLKLELIPVLNPTTLKKDENATFKLLRDGEPAPNVAIALVRGGSNERAYQNTDADGVVRFTVSAAGKYLLATTDLTPGKEGELWQGLFSTFTFEAR